MTWQLYNNQIIIIFFFLDHNSNVEHSRNNLAITFKNRVEKDFKKHTEDRQAHTRLFCCYDVYIIKAHELLCTKRLCVYKNRVMKIK